MLSAAGVTLPALRPASGTHPAYAMISKPARLNAKAKSMVYLPIEIAALEHLGRCSDASTQGAACVMSPARAPRLKDLCLARSAPPIEHPAHQMRGPAL